MNDKTRSGRAATIALSFFSLWGVGCQSPFHTTDADYGLRVAESRLRTIQAGNVSRFVAPPEPTPEQERPADVFEGMERVEITLEQVRAWVIERNPDLRVALISPTISREALSEEEAKFESILYSRLSYTDSTRPTASELANNEFRSIEVEPGVRIPLRSGGTATVSFPVSEVETNNAFSTLNPSYSANPTFSLNQPLLRGAGRRTTTHSIRIASLNYQISEAQTKLEVIRLIAAAERAYWRYYAAGRALEVRQLQYELAVEQLERARRQVRAGRVAEIEVIRAEAGVADRLEAILLAQRSVQDTLRDLKRIINVPGLEMESNVVLVPVSHPDPVKYDLPPSELADIAVSERMEMLELELRLAQDASQIDFARNAALPLFTVDYTYRLPGLGSNSSRAFGSIDPQEFDEHSLSLLFEAPIGNERARARVQQAVLTRLQRLSTREARTLAIRQETLGAINGVDSGWQRVIAARQSTLLNGRALVAEQRQFEVGASTSTDVLDASTRLADAQLAEIRALAEYEISLIDLAFATGTLLGASKVSWEPLDPRSPGDFNPRRGEPPPISGG